MFNKNWLSLKHIAENRTCISLDWDTPSLCQVTLLKWIGKSQTHLPWMASFSILNVILDCFLCIFHASISRNPLIHAANGNIIIQYSSKHKQQTSWNTKPKAPVIHKWQISDTTNKQYSFQRLQQQTPNSYKKLHLQMLGKQIQMITRHNQWST